MADESGDLIIELNGAGEPSPCAYLPGQTSRFEYRWAMSLTERRYEMLLERGWRRFGRTLFRPVCASCRECRSLRVVLPASQFSGSQRRCLRRNADVTCMIQRPTVSDQHVQLYNDYHRAMSDLRGWPYRPTTQEEYHDSFVDGQFSFAREYLYHCGGSLVGIGLVDVTPHVQSSVYFVHHPDWRNRSPGTFSILSEILEGRSAGRAYHYLGYYIRDCGSMNYKNRFHPHQMLQGLVSEWEEPVWSAP